MLAPMPFENAEWLAEYKTSVRARLTRVRGALTDEEFERLIADVVRTAERFVAIERSLGTSTPDPLTELKQRLADP
jgi:hypothetical protein